MDEQSWDEFEIIHQFFSRASGQPPEGLIAGIGDDAAVLKNREDSPTLITHDMMVEDIHFRAAWMSPYDLARKLTKVNLSDIAAMGGIPRYALLSIALPRVLPAGWLNQFSEGLHTTFQEYGLSLVGGDTSLSPGPVVVAMTLLGTCGSGGPLFRQTPKAGETLYVTGFLGDAALGLYLLRHEKTTPPPRDEKEVHALIRRHLDPTPRLETGQALAAKGLATTMIDISDGLIGDLNHLIENTPLGARIFFDRLPLSDAFVHQAPRLHPDPENLIFSGGEDYELLFTSPHDPGRMANLARAIPAKITAIGEITETGGIEVVKDDHPIPLKTGGYRHQFHQKGSS